MKTPQFQMPGVSFDNETGVRRPWEMSQQHMPRVPGPHFQPGVSGAAQRETAGNLAPLVADMGAGIDTQNRLQAAGMDADLNRQLTQLQLGDYRNQVSRVAPWNAFQGAMNAMPYSLSAQLGGSVLGGILGNVGNFIGQ